MSYQIPTIIIYTYIFIYFLLPFYIFLYLSFLFSIYIYTSFTFFIFHPIYPPPPPPFLGLLPWPDESLWDRDETSPPPPAHHPAGAPPPFHPSQGHPHYLSQHLPPPFSH